MSDTPKAQLDWLIDNTLYGYNKLVVGAGGTDNGASADAVLTAAQHLAVTVFIQAAKAPRPRPNGGTAAPPPTAPAATAPPPSSSLPQTGDYVPKPVNRAAYCDCDHECWQQFGPDYDGCACEPGACLSKYGKACGCIKPLPQMRGKVGFVADERNEGRWRWVEGPA